MIAGHVLFLIERKEVDGYLEASAGRARGVRREGDEGPLAALRNCLNVLEANAGFVGADFAFVELPAHFLDKWDKLRAIVGALFRIRTAVLESATAD